MRAFLERELRQVDHLVAEASALLPEAVPAVPERQAPHTARPLANRWLALPALTTLKAFDELTGPCRCAAPMAADRDFFPPVMPPATEAEVAWRLHHATAHPYLAAQLATATFTAASTTQLATAQVRDLGADGTTITLHDHGLRQGCMTHPVPDWARPLLRAAALLLADRVPAPAAHSSAIRWKARADALEGLQRGLQAAATPAPAPQAAPEPTRDNADSEGACEDHLACVYRPLRACVGQG